VTACDDALVAVEVIRSQVVDQGASLAASLDSHFALVRAALAPDLPADLAEIQARADAATPGPWYQGRDKISGESDGEAWTREDCTDPESCDLFPTAAREEDAHFIAHARTDVPALVAEVAALRAEIQRLRTAPADTACPGCGGSGYQSSFDGNSGGTCGHCGGSGIDLDRALVELAALRAAPRLTAEEASDIMTVIRYRATEKPESSLLVSLLAIVEQATT